MPLMRLVSIPGLSLSSSQILRLSLLMDRSHPVRRRRVLHVGPLKGNLLGVDWLYRLVMCSVPDGDAILALSRTLRSRARLYLGRSHVLSRICSKARSTPEAVP